MKESHSPMTWPTLPNMSDVPSLFIRISNTSWTCLRMFRFLTTLQILNWKKNPIKVAVIVRKSQTGEFIQTLVCRYVSPRLLVKCFGANGPACFSPLQPTWPALKCALLSAPPGDRFTSNTRLYWDQLLSLDPSDCSREHQASGMPKDPRGGWGGAGDHWPCTPLSLVTVLIYWSKLNPPFTPWRLEKRSGCSFVECPFKDATLDDKSNGESDVGPFSSNTSSVLVQTGQSFYFCSKIS